MQLLHPRSLVEIIDAPLLLCQMDFLIAFVDFIFSFHVDVVVIFYKLGWKRSRRRITMTFFFFPPSATLASTRLLLREVYTPIIALLLHRWGSLAPWLLKFISQQWWVDRLHSPSLQALISVPSGRRQRPRSRCRCSPRSGPGSTS